MTYSQHGEDDLVFNYIEKKKFGRYIDIGAGTPKEINNTYMMYQMGWEGLLIEPSPILTPLLSKARPKDILYRGALLDYTGEVTLCTKNCYGITEASWIYGSHKARARGDGFTVKEFQVKCTTLPKLIKRYPQFKEPDFVSIDVDGNEDHILRTINFEVFKPTLILMEYGLRQIDHRAIWGHYLTSHYDMVWQNSSDCFYLRKGSE